MDLSHLIDAAELASRFSPGGDRIETAFAGMEFRELEMRDHFVVQLALDAIGTPQGGDARDQSPDGHALASRIRATRAAACSQLATSMWTCFVPASVSE